MYGLERSKLHNKCVAIFVASKLKGMLISMGLELKNKYSANVIFIAKDVNVKNVILRHIPDHKNIKVLSEIECMNFNDKDILIQALEIEKKYGVNLAFLMSLDRALGQGYLFNVEKVPDIKRSSLNHLDKLRYLICQFRRIEESLDNVDILISEFTDGYRSVISKKNNILSLSLVLARYGNRYLWSDNDYQTSTPYIERVKYYLSSNISIDQSESNINYAPHNMGEGRLSVRNFNYFRSIKQSIGIIYNDTKIWIRGNYAKDSYHLYGWVPSRFRAIHNYNYVNKIGVDLNDIKKYKVIYFTLHIEPEVSLLYFSPEFSNTIEAVTWLSKSIPSDVMIVLKEHPFSYGVRSIEYYKKINKIGNICWSKPEIDSKTWIEKSNAIATITGTVGTEGVYYEKPVISFGKHQVINMLPSVFYVKNYEDTKNAVKKIFDNTIKDDTLSLSKSVCHNALFDSSFEMSNYQNIHASEELQPEFSLIAIKNLLD
jgi:hypothetical protein